MFRSWFPIAVALVAAPALFAAEVEVKPSATPAPSSSVGVRPGTSPSAELPKYRPAVLPLGPDSVINRIDTAGLIRDGQKDASLYFCSAVNKFGEILDTWTYKQ